MLSTALFATWIAEALGRTLSAGAQPDTSASGWLSRIVRALLWSLRHQSPAGIAGGESYEDSEVWNHILSVQDAVPIFFEVSKRDAERIQQLALGDARPSVADLDRARQAFLRKVVPALTALYGTEN